MIGQALIADQVVLIADQVVLYCLTDCLASKQGSDCVPLTDTIINVRTYIHHLAGDAFLAVGCWL